MRKTLTWWYVFPVFLWSWRALLQASQISPDALTPKQTSNSSFFSTCLKGLPCDFLPHTTQPFFDLSLLSLSFKIQNKTHAKKTTNRPAYTAILHLMFFVLVLPKKSGKRTRARHVRRVSAATYKNLFVLHMRRQNAPLLYKWCSLNDWKQTAQRLKLQQSGY